jgi:LuxR family maltose regulon positive regulatory protein
MNPLLATKLHLPSPHSPLVQRKRLVEKLNRGLTSRLILVSAAAGFGKTTVLSEWAHQLEVPVSWLWLDELDNDPARFWTYVVAAVQQTDSTIGAATLAMLRSTEPLPVEVYLIPLINELAQLQTEFILVLDDYHTIATPRIHEALIFLLEHLPTQVHVAIATRIDPPFPLSKWRVRDRLTELHTDDLRFTDEEASIFLHQSLLQPLTQLQVATLQTKTEGWIAGLQLTMLSLRETANPASSIDSFSGNQRYILDYLVEEVLERQSQSLRSFLLRTSILGQMCGSLCETVVGGNGVNGADMLEQLERQNLFIVPLDRDRTWYRYHHLFAESLRHILDRMEPNCIWEYHARAALWYERQGYIAEAIDHALAARSIEDAARLIEREIQTQEHPRVDAIGLRNALAQFAPELIQTRPWLLVAKAWTAFISSQFIDAIAAIDSLEQLLNQNSLGTANTDRLWGLVIALKGMQARQQGNAAASIALMERALQLLPPDNSWLRSLILLNLGVTYFVADNYAAAKRLLPEVSRIGKASGTADPAIAGLYLQAQFLGLRGRLDAATSLCQPEFDEA